MDKVATLNKEQYEKIKKQGVLGTEVRVLLGIPRNRKVRIGDSMVHIGTKSEERDVFKYVHNGTREVFYIVISPEDEMDAFCLCIN